MRAISIGFSPKIKIFKQISSNNHIILKLFTRLEYACPLKDLFIYLEF